MPVCRIEYEKRYPLANGRVVTVKIRDTITPEDPYLMLVRAAALAARTNEPFNAERIPKAIKDFLIKTNISI